MKVLCFALFACAFNLLIGYRRAAVVRPRHVPRHGRLRRGARGQGLGLAAGARRSSPAPRRRGCSAWSSALLAIRRQGIYFAMITLALAQMVYFFCLQAPFTGGEDGIQAVPRGKLFGLHRPRPTSARCTTSVLAIFLAGFLLIYRIDPFAVRPGAEGDPRERAARDLARLRHRPLQAAGLRAVGRARRPRRRHQGASCSSSPRSPTCTGRMSGEVVLMTLLGGLGTIFGPVVGAFIIIALENYLAQLGAWVTVVQGVDLRRLRARLPPRHRRRDRPLHQEAALASSPPEEGAPAIRRFIQ